MTRTFAIIAIIAVVILIVILPVVGGGLLIYQNFDAIIAWLAAASDPTQVIPCSASQACSITHPIVYGLILVLVILTGFAYTTLLERKLLAWLQHRVGPNRVGPLGFLQPAADGIKLVFKEDVIPDQADKPVFYLAPMLKAVPALILFSVLPLGPDIVVPWFNGMWYQVPLGLSDVNVAVLYLLAITSLGTYGMILAGWASNNKYAMLGGLRASAQMISYELSMGLAIAVPVLLVSSMSMGDIIDAQRNVWDWFVFQNPLAAGILIVALFAEVSRAPFDLTEAEQELTAGFMTEYSGMKFAMFMMAEYIGMIVVSMIAIGLFFGGYHFFPVDSIPLLGPLVYIGKIVVFLSFFIWARATLPRVRYDRLMALGWKVMLPLALLSVAWSSIAVVVGDVANDSIMTIAGETTSVLVAITIVVLGVCFWRGWQRAAGYVALLAAWIVLIPTLNLVPVYIYISGLFFLIVVIAGIFFISAESEAEEQELDLADDPLITGERTGLNWALLNVVGGLVAIPFVIVNAILNTMEEKGAMAQGDESAIVPSEQGGD